VCHDDNFARICTDETVPKDFSGKPAKVRDVEWNKLDHKPQFKDRMPLHFSGDIPEK